MALTAPPPSATPMVPQPPGATASVAKTDASPASQVLVFLACCVAFSAIGVRARDLVVAVAPAAALALGIAVCIGTDVRKALRTFPGIVAAMLAMLALTVAWAFIESRNGSFPYGVVPLVGVLIVGLDWAWVERLRPLVVASGLAMVFLFDADLAVALGFALVWFATTAAALWSLQRDTRRALPTPTPLAGGAVHRVDPSGQELALIAGASIALGLVLTLLISMISLELNPPTPPGSGLNRPALPRPGGGQGSPGGGQGSPGGGQGAPSGGSGSSGGSAGGSSRSGGVLGGVDRDGDGVVDGGGVQDDDGDGVIEGDEGVALLDANGDGVIDERDASDPVDVDGDGDIDGDDGYVFLDRDGDGRIDHREGGRPGDRDGDGNPDPGPPDRNGDGTIDRNDVPVVSDTNGDGVIDRRDVVIVQDLDGDGRIGAGDVARGADRNGDGRVDGRDDLDGIDRNGDGAVDDDELLGTLDRDGDGRIDREEALALDRDGDGRLSPSEIGELPLSGEQGRQLEEQRREMEAEDLTRALLVALGVVLLVAALVVAAVLIRRRLARHQERASRAWALVLVERLEVEGSRRGRPRRRNEPITHYAAVLGDGPLANARLAEVGLLISRALFGPTPVEDAVGADAARIVDEAVAAHPLPTRAERRRARRAAAADDADPSPDAERVGARAD